jgi:hypothetical protein
MRDLEEALAVNKIAETARSSETVATFQVCTGTAWQWFPAVPPQELLAILCEVERAIKIRLYYVAIAVALSIPDICACLEFDPDNPRRANESTYAGWCDTNISPAFKNLSGVDLYRLRCGVLHFGNFAHPKAKFNRVMLIGPESAIKAHDIVIEIGPDVTFGGVDVGTLRLSGKVLQLDVVRFCNTITNAARKWSINKLDDPFIRKNLPNLIRYRPYGLPPFSIGVPTIA